MRHGQHEHPEKPLQESRLAPSSAKNTPQGLCSAKHMPPRPKRVQTNARPFDDAPHHGLSPSHSPATASNRDSPQRNCPRLKQGFHQTVTRWVSGVLLCWVSSWSGAKPVTCPADAPQIQALDANLWWVAGAPGDANAANRGRTDNLLILKDAQRVWLLGSGATPAAGRALSCVLRQRWGRPVTDVINPWARPEVVLGNQAFTQHAQQVRLWAHTDVATTMRQQCPRCIERLHQRLGRAATDLGPNPITLPTHLLTGEQGQLGPWQWWRLERAPNSVVTVWHLTGSPWWWAPGLLWSDGPPDLRDTHIPALAHALNQLAALATSSPTRARWIPTQGSPLEHSAPAEQQTYLLELAQHVRAQQDLGTLETAPPMPSSGPPYLMQGERPALNWQRAWRQEELGMR